jgi:hypothetical protein
MNNLFVYCEIEDGNVADVSLGTPYQRSFAS